MIAGAAAHVRYAKRGAQTAAKKPKKGSVSLDTIALIIKKSDLLGQIH
jgi:hypothetical protein